MNELQIFNSSEFGEIRTVTIDNEPMFCLADVCKALEISNVGNVKQRLSKKGIHTADTPTNGGIQKMTFINEPNLYKTIFQSRKESAERFTDWVTSEVLPSIRKSGVKHWVTSEVLPSIRKSGGYIAGQEQMSDAELMAKALMVAHRQIEERNKQIEVMKPKAIFADAVSASKTSILVGDLAKLICQNGYQIGQKRLFEWLRENGYLIKHGSSKNMPTQRYVEQGLFEVKESNLQNPDGSVRITRTTKITGKGQVYFVNKFIENVEVNA